MASVELILETNLNTSDSLRQPNLAYSFIKGSGVHEYTEGFIGLETRFSIIQIDDKKDSALAFLRESARDGILSISIRTLERASDGIEEQRGSILFQISKGEKYHVISVFVPKSEFHFLASVIAGSKRRTYAGSLRAVGETIEWLLPFLRKGIIFSVTMQFNYDPKDFDEWLKGVGNNGDGTKELDITYFSFHF